VGIGAAHAAHLVQDDGNAGVCDLPRGFGAREPAADDVDGRMGRGLGHARLIITPRHDSKLDIGRKPDI
jgi:hypothetical protein